MTASATPSSHLTNNNVDQDLEEEKPLQEEQHCDSPGENARLKDVLQEFSYITSIHGLPYAMDRVHFKPWKRILWYFLLVSSLTAMCWQIAILIRDYRQFSVVTSYSVELPDSLPFPSVTVCDSNMFSQYYINETGIQNPLNESQLLAISERLDDFLISTTFNTVNIANLSDYWKPVITPFGQCFTFQTTEEVYRPGFVGGLQFYGLVDQSDYVNATTLAGVSVVVHQNGTTINYQSPFTFVAPGSQSLITLDYIEYEREREKPWSQCYSEAPAYTRNECRATCEYKYEEQQCGCRDFGDPDTSYNYCTPDQWDACTLDYDTLVCDCTLPPCTEEMFPTKVSNMAFAQQFLNEVASEEGVTPEIVQANLFSVTVNFEVIRKQLLTESKSMTPTQLLSNIGGTGGLYAGMSFISMVELFGELCGLRLFPRTWGDRRLHGVGSRV